MDPQQTNETNQNVSGDNLQVTARQRKTSVVLPDSPAFEAVEIADIHTDGTVLDTCGECNDSQETTFIENGADNIDVYEVSELDNRDTEQRFDEEKQMDLNPLPTDTTKCLDQLPDNGIVYDDTKPKRLPNPNRKNLNLNLGENQRNPSKASPRSSIRESISVLISPDSPTKRIKRLPDIDVYRQHAEDLDDELDAISSNKQTLHVDTVRVVPDIERGEHYQRSPEPSRRKLSHRTTAVVTDHNQTHRCASPVTRRLVNKHESDVQRKYSLDARLARNQLKTNLPPQRKISLGARFEARRNSDETNALEQIRCRKVSFDTTALYNGTKFMPLNDEIAANETHTESDDGVFIEVPSENNAKPEHSQDRSTHDVQQYSEDSESPRYRADGHIDTGTSYYDNEAYTNDNDDDGDQQFNCKTRISPDTYDTYADDNNEPALIEHTHTFSHKRIHPNGVAMTKAADERVKRVSSQSDDSGLPKSILKIRKEDTESMVSEDSIASTRSPKVRKDSIALFTDKNGEIQLHALRKEYSNTWRPFGKQNIKQLWANRKEIFQKYKLHLFVLLLFSMTLAFVVVGLHFHGEHHQQMEIARRIFFNARKRLLSIVDPKHEDAFTGVLGLGIPQWQQPTHCYSNFQEFNDKTCLQWKDHGQLDIDFWTEGDTNCYTIKWNFKNGQRPFDCFHLSNSYWYGPSNMSNSDWPLQRSKFKFIDSRSNFHDSGTFSHAFEYYWISSSGSSIFVETEIPLEISWNSLNHRQVCFIGVDVKRVPSDDVKTGSGVTYTMCNGVNTRSTHEMMSKKFISHVKSLPSNYLLQKPHWSTVWESRNFTMNASVATHLAKQLQKHELDCSTIEIDGKWEQHYGDFIFNEDKFPNMTDMLTRISMAGCQVSLIIYPYISFQSEPFKDDRLKNEYFIKDKSKTVPALVHWQHELAAMLDISNPNARDWINGKLANLSELYNLKTFRLGYGISDWFPHNPTFHGSEVTPNKLKFMYTELLSSFGQIIVQSTSNSQNITSLIGITTHVETDEKTGVSCLSNMIPDMLHLGITGYPFVMADGFLSGRNADDKPFRLPSRSLFIRWMQIASFIPAMRYTIKPWSYDSEVVQLSKNLSRFHKENIVNTFYEFESNLLQGEPFIQPLWWADPLDSNTFPIGDQFIVAGKYLVAPILCENDADTIRRDIYIPKGLWMDMVSKRIAKGPRWIKGYAVSQNTIPYFEKMPEINEW